MKRVPLFVSFLLFIALCASIAYWALQLYKPPTRPVAAPPRIAQAEVSPDAAAALFGGRPGKVAVASNFQLKGVILSGTERDSVAIVSANGKPAQAVGVGMELIPGVTVKEVHREYVLLSEGGAVKRVELPENVKMQVNLATTAPVGTQGAQGATGAQGAAATQGAPAAPAAGIQSTVTPPPNLSRGQAQAAQISSGARSPLLPPPPPAAAQPQSQPQTQAPQAQPQVQSQTAPAAPATVVTGSTASSQTPVPSAGTPAPSPVAGATAPNAPAAPTARNSGITSPSAPPTGLASGGFGGTGNAASGASGGGTSGSGGEMLPPSTLQSR